uniref:Uncharacterized protein n=1 Tax=Moschus moschiferus TaxID=68415 RepID=A0A8C6FR01_MOSMO
YGRHEGVQQQRNSQWGSKINASKNQQDDGKILKILNFLWIQKQMKEEDFALLHIQMRSQ